MSTGQLAATLVFVGLVVALAFGLADFIGLGQSAGFGTGQIAGVVVGVIILLVGLRVRSADL